MVLTMVLSPNNFTNMLNVDKMTISATQDNGKFNHNLLLDFSDNKSYYQMAEAFNMYDNELKLT